MCRDMRKRHLIRIEHETLIIVIANGLGRRVFFRQGLFYTGLSVDDDYDHRGTFRHVFMVRSGLRSMNANNGAVKSDD